MLLSAFGACLAAGIHANAIARQIEITSLSLDLSADVDRSVHWGRCGRQAHRLRGRRGRRHHRGRRACERPRRSGEARRPLVAGGQHPLQSGAPQGFARGRRNRLTGVLTGACPPTSRPAHHRSRRLSASPDVVEWLTLFLPIRTEVRALPPNEGQDRSDGRRPLEIERGPAGAIKRHDSLQPATITDGKVKAGVSRCYPGT